MQADLIVTNARVLTMDAGRPRAEAVAIRAGRVQAVGTAAGMAALVGPGTRVIDAGGRTVLPGFFIALFYYVMYRLAAFFFRGDRAKSLFALAHTLSVPMGGFGCHAGARGVHHRHPQPGEGLHQVVRTTVDPTDQAVGITDLLSG